MVGLLDWSLVVVMRWVLTDQVEPDDGESADGLHAGTGGNWACRPGGGGKRVRLNRKTPAHLEGRISWGLNLAFGFGRGILGLQTGSTLIQRGGMCINVLMVHNLHGIKGELDETQLEHAQAHISRPLHDF